MQFNFIDILIFVLFVVFIIKGYNSGLIKQLITLIAVILSLYIAIKGYDYVANILIDQFELGLKLAQIISFAIIIIGVSLIVNYIGYIFSQVADFLFLSIIDNMGGAFLGFLKAFIIIYFIISLINKIDLNLIDEYLKESYFASKIILFDPMIEDRINEFLQQF